MTPGSAPAAGAAPWRRIVVVGSSGAGKTHFGRSLAAALGVRHIELDGLFWGPDWTQKSPEEFRRLVSQAVADDAWVVDGNYSVARDLVWPRAQVVVWLNLGFARVFGRSLRRTLGRIALRQPLWHDNRESFVRTFFTRQSILWWVIRTFGRTRHKYATLRHGGHHPHLVWFEVRSPAQAEDCMRHLCSGSGR
jgi:adenylate kinase family enzyme